MPDEVASRGALSGVRVLDCSNIIAGPFCAALLADFGAEVIKVEMPGVGDSSRHLGTIAAGTSMIWRSLNRNKRTVTLDLHVEEGRCLFRRLAGRSDVVVQNFLPETQAQWELSYEHLVAEHPELVMVSVSGFGQTGQMAHWPGVARTAMAFGGIMHLTGEPDGPPLIPGSAGLADYVTGIYAAFGAVTALRHRDRTGNGQEVDVALYEAVFQMLGDPVETFDHLGEVQGRFGSMNPHAAPHNNFRAEDDKWVAIGCTSNQLFSKLVTAMGRPDLLEVERFSSNRNRVAHREELEAVVSTWVQERPASAAVATLVEHGVPASLIYTVADAFADDHYWERGALVRIPTDDLGDLATRGVVPRLTATPGQIDRLGGRLGADNDDVYGEVLGLKPDEIARLRRDRVI